MSLRGGEKGNFPTSWALDKVEELRIHTALKYRSSMGNLRAKAIYVYVLYIY